MVHKETKQENKLKRIDNFEYDCSVSQCETSLNLFYETGPLWTVDNLNMIAQFPSVKLR